VLEAVVIDVPVERVRDRILEDDRDELRVAQRRFDLVPPGRAA
jgi:hypothetical protein